MSRRIFSGCVTVSCGSTAASSRQLPNDEAVYNGHSRSKPERNLHPRQKCTTGNETVSQTLLGKSAPYGPLLLWLGYLLEGTKLAPCEKVASWLAGMITRALLFERTGPIRVSCIWKLGAKWLFLWQAFSSGSWIKYAPPLKQPFKTKWPPLEYSSFLSVT